MNVSRLGAGLGSLGSRHFEDVMGRTTLTANRTYYVRKDGNDANNGLTNNAAGAKLTIMGALNAAKQIDFNGYTVTVKIDDGTYAERVIVPAMTGQAGAENLLIEGNTSTPTNVIVSNSNSYQPCVEALGPARVTVAAFRVTAPTNGYGLNAAEAGVINVSTGMDFGACGEYHMYANNGGTINCFNPYTISGSAAAHWVCGYGGNLYSATTVNAGGASIAFSFGFAGVFACGAMQVSGNTFSNVGSVTGPRYAAQSNGVIQTFGAGASYLPGNSAGSTSSGGVYQ